MIDAQRRALCETSALHYGFVINAVASTLERSLIAITNAACDLLDVPPSLPRPGRDVREVAIVSLRLLKASRIASAALCRHPYGQPSEWSA